MSVVHGLATWLCLFMTPWTVARQVPLSTELPRQEYWSGVSFPSPGDLPHPGIKSEPPAFTGSLLDCMQVNSLPLSHWGTPQKT